MPSEIDLQGAEAPASAARVRRCSSRSAPPGLLIIVLMVVRRDLRAVGRAVRSARRSTTAACSRRRRASICSGTDSFGRDVLSRIIYGARTALAVGFLVLADRLDARRDHRRRLGLLRRQDRPDHPAAHGRPPRRSRSSCSRSRWSRCSARTSCFGIDVNLIIAIGLPMVPKVARVVRSSALAIREMPYIDAARTAGFSHARIIFRHIVPNVVAPYLIMLTAFVGAGDPARSFAVVPRPRA